jgi:hypothetical protein
MKEIEIYGNCFERVRIFKYLGALFTESDDISI